MLKFIFILGFLVLFFHSCRKDFTPSVNGGITPYIIDYPTVLKNRIGPMKIPVDNPMTVQGVELGRKLFYDNILSGNQTQACATCHAPNSSFGDNEKFSTGINGELGNRNSMPLINLGWADEYFWDGRSKTLELQALEPVINPIEMHETWPNAVAKLQASATYPTLFEKAFNTNIIDSVLVAKALAQFQRTLLSGDAPFDRYFRGEPTGYSHADDQNMIKGYYVFLADAVSGGGDCAHCHGDETNPLFTDNLFHNNGLDEMFTDLGLGAVTGNPNDNGKFKTPTLRNLLFSAPYMHDGRFQTLDQVIDHYSFGLKNSATIDPLMKNVANGGVQLNSENRALLMAFLISLTDSSFITNPYFQAP
ncbi:cytochrome-c peroxidase [Putridiphycobacter roseus]|uniref:Cytochrome-c peroxidase n=1 Tax=Putridiphycobacter roseus TaxID=2219161 RepID=A0A2W1N0V1_9FLAO|nr:cytochrome c peroxidase [Putridiphycobacter roseus]PZE16591.1 cytochrome-c peroxidase [Putridiphycobacter roseus]